jgi:hypothetical protein
MNREEFIEKLVLLYEDFNEKNIKARKEAYEIVLSNELNFDKIYKTLLEQYESFKFAPSPAYINKLIEKMPKYGEGLF